MRTILLILGILSVLTSCGRTTKQVACAEKRTFYVVGENDTVLTYQKFVIEKQEFVFDRLDMEWYANHLSTYHEEGDSLIELYFDKVINTDEYERGNIVLYEEATPIVKKSVLRKNRHSHIWERWDDGELYKYRLIDSLDIQKSGYPVDTVNHWLDDAEITDNENTNLQTKQISRDDKILIGFIDNDTFVDTLYIHTEAIEKYDEQGCQEQTDKATLRIVLGNGEKVFIEDEEIFDYPYAGSAALTYSLDSKGGIIRSSASSRHSDHIYVKSYYRYDNKQKYWFKTKTITIQEEGGEEIDKKEETFAVGKFPLGTEIRVACDF